MEPSHRTIMKKHSNTLQKLETVYQNTKNEAIEIIDYAISVIILFQFL